MNPERLRELVTKWRARQAAWEKSSKESLPSTYNCLDAIAEAIQNCTDELEPVLAQAQPACDPPPSAWWLDRIHGAVAEGIGKKINNLRLAAQIHASVLDEIARTIELELTLKRTAAAPEVKP